MAIESNKWGIIYNPHSGTRKMQKRWKKILAYIEQRGIDFDYVQSEGYGAVERLARTLANNGYRTIVVVGGDGALNDALNGILSSSAERKTDIALGIIPNGIGNDFARFWGLEYEDYEAAVDCIVNHRTRLVDVGCCAYYDEGVHKKRYFLNAINIGLGARVVHISNGTKRFWGMKGIASIASLFLLLFQRKLYRCHLKLNGEHIRGRIMTLCVGSARGYGLTPNAVPYNGWLDVSVVYRPEILQLFSGLWMLLQGRFLNHKVVKSYRTKKVKVFRVHNGMISLDGCVLRTNYPLEIGIEPETIQMIIPR